MTASATFFKEPNLHALVEKIAREEGFQQPTYSISNASKPGQNFIGRLFRVVIKENHRDGEEKTLSLIFKASSTNLKRQEKMGGGRLFCTESQMYQIVLPTLNKILQKYGVEDSPIFPGTPRCLAVELNYGSGRNLADVLVLEDKKVDGFEVLDVKKGLNGDQCRLALKRVALLHATSMATHELEPETARYLQKTLYKSYKIEEFHEFFTEIYRGLLNALDMLGDPYKPGHPVYDRLHQKYDEFCFDLKARLEVPSDVFCITHTDFTSNNILFKLNDDGSTEDACLIDFQTATPSSPVNDLASLLIVCTKKEVRDEYLKSVLQFYHDEVTRILLAFGCDPDKLFPWDLYERHLKRYMRYGVVNSLMALPIMLADASEFNFDMHSQECNSALLTGLAEVKNPETLKLLKQRLRDNVADAVRYGYL